MTKSIPFPLTQREERKWQSLEKTLREQGLPILSKREVRAIKRKMVKNEWVPILGYFGKVLSNFYLTLSTIISILVLGLAMGHLGIGILLSTGVFAAYIMGISDKIRWFYEETGPQWRSMKAKRYFANHYRNEEAG